MKETPDFSQIVIGGRPLASLQMTGSENLVTSQGVPTEKSSPKVAGNLDSIESAIALVGIGFTAFSIGVASRFGKSTDSNLEVSALYVASSAFALATACYILDALAN